MMLDYKVESEQDKRLLCQARTKIRKSGSLATHKTYIEGWSNWVYAQADPSLRRRTGHFTGLSCSEFSNCNPGPQS